MLENGDECVDLLLQLKNTSIPKCLNIGDELAYVAYRDKIIDYAIGRCSTTTQKTSGAPQLLSINHHELAQQVIDNTFDAHKNLLRNRAKKAEEEALRWKTVALSLRHDAHDLFLETAVSSTDGSPIFMQCGVQTDDPAPRVSSAVQVSGCENPVLFSIDEWTHIMENLFDKALHVRIEEFLNSAAAVSKRIFSNSACAGLNLCEGKAKKPKTKIEPVGDPCAQRNFTHGRRSPKSHLPRIHSVNATVWSQASVSPPSKSPLFLIESVQRPQPPAVL